MGAYEGKASTIKEAKEKTNGFKKGGKTVMSEAAKGRKPRASGGGVMSSAAKGTPRGPASHY
jgi:hypothetical protein